MNMKTVTMHRFILLHLAPRTLLKNLWNSIKCFIMSPAPIFDGHLTGLSYCIMYALANKEIGKLAFCIIVIALLFKCILDIILLYVRMIANIALAFIGIAWVTDIYRVPD